MVVGEAVQNPVGPVLLDSYIVKVDTLICNIFIDSSTRVDKIFNLETLSIIIYF